MKKSEQTDIYYQERHSFSVVKLIPTLTLQHVQQEVSTLNPAIPVIQIMNLFFNCFT
jgi:hypothetical protein